MWKLTELWKNPKTGFPQLLEPAVHSSHNAGCCWSFLKHNFSSTPPPCSGDCVMSAGLLRSRDRWQPQQSQVHHGSDGPGYLDRTPTCTGPRSGPFRVRIEAWQRWGGVGQSFQENLVRSKSRMFCDRNETMMMQNARTVRRSVDAQEGPEKEKERKPLH